MTAATPTGEATLLAGKTVLITGAARRVGAEIARLMHSSGANLVLLAVGVLTAGLLARKR